jgi:hypothetical protein
MAAIFGPTRVIITRHTVLVQWLAAADYSGDRG